MPINITEYTVTEDPITTTIAAITSAVMFNDTVDVVLNNATLTDVVTVAPAKLNDVYYIYIWAAAILGCIIITSGRFVLVLTLYLVIQKQIISYLQVFLFDLLK